MRNWNYSERNFGRPLCNVLSLPMRNWNKLYALYNRPRRSVLSLPMRNWNYCLPFGLSILVAFSAYLWGIETSIPTIRPLSSWQVLSLPMRNWNQVATAHANCASCSQPTYEELKPHNIVLDAMWSRVLSLPMRNWNLKDPAAIKAATKFSAYLWGIETGMSARGWFFCFFCSQPTYEELKPYSTTPVWARVMVLSLPMRNWNAPLSPVRGCV